MKLTITKQFQAFIEAIGLSMDSVLEKAEIPNMLWKEEIELSETQYMNFLYQLDEVITDEQILAFSKIDEISAFMPAFYVALCAKNGEMAFERFSTYKKLICPLIIDIEKNNKELKIHLKFDVGNGKMPKFSLLNEQMVLISLLRTGTGKNIIPIKLESPYEYSGKINDFVGKKSVKTKDNILIFDINDVKLPFITQNNVMSEYLEPELKRRLKELSQENTFMNIVEKTLISAIPSGHFSREEIAKTLGLSVRSFQRKFTDEGTTFAEELDNVRKMLVMQYIKKDNLSLEEIASLVGYENQPALSRAFKRWTGKTITQYKNNLEG